MQQAVKTHPMNLDQEPEFMNSNNDPLATNPLPAANCQLPTVHSTPWDKLREECGIFAIVSHPEAARLSYLGIYALQHRGQESEVIVS